MPPLKVIVSTAAAATAAPAPANGNADGTANPQPLPPRHPSAQYYRRKLQGIAIFAREVTRRIQSDGGVVGVVAEAAVSGARAGVLEALEQALCNGRPARELCAVLPTAGKLLHDASRGQELQYLHLALLRFQLGATHRQRQEQEERLRERQAQCRATVAAAGEADVSSDGAAESAPRDEAAAPTSTPADAVDEVPPPTPLQDDQ